MMIGQAGKWALLAAAVSLAGCGGGSSVGSSGLSRAPQVVPYKGKLAKSKEDERDFSVTVEAGGAGLDLIRESARYYATRYCLLTYGTSDAIWVTGSDGEWLTVRDGGDLTVSGRCTGRS